MSRILKALLFFIVFYGSFAAFASEQGETPLEDLERCKALALRIGEQISELSIAKEIKKVAKEYRSTLSRDCWTHVDVVRGYGFCSIRAGYNNQRSLPSEVIFEEQKRKGLAVREQIKDLVDELRRSGYFVDNSFDEQLADLIITIRAELPPDCIHLLDLAVQTGSLSVPFIMPNEKG